MKQYRIMGLAGVLGAAVVFGRPWYNAVLEGDLDHAAGQCLLFFGLAMVPCGIIAKASKDLRFARILLATTTAATDFALLIVISRCVVVSEVWPVVAVATIVHITLAISILWLQRKSGEAN